MSGLNIRKGDLVQVISGKDRGVKGKVIEVIPEADKIIEYLRAQRAKFAQQEAAPKPKKSPRQKGPVLTADDILGALE